MMDTLHQAYRRACSDRAAVITTLRLLQAQMKPTEGRAVAVAILEALRDRLTERVDIARTKHLAAHDAAREAYLARGPRTRSK